MMILRKVFDRLAPRADEPAAATGPSAWGQTVWHPTHRHRKGGLYRWLGVAVYEADRSDVVLYDDADGIIWVRSQAEFEDGRFSPINPGWQTAPET